MQSEMRTEARRLWCQATVYAKESLNTNRQHQACQIMQATGEFYLSKEQMPEVTTGLKSRIWAAFQEAKHERSLENRNVSGVLVHVYRDDTMLLVNRERNLPEIYAHHRDHGTLFCGIIEDNQIKLTLGEALGNEDK